MDQHVEAGTALVEIPRETALKVFSNTTPELLQPYLDMIRREIDAFAPDVETTQGRKDIASFAYRIARTKTGLDAVGKELADEAKKVPKRIDANRKHVKDTLQSWQDEVRKPLDDWEAAEKARIARHAAAIERIGRLAHVTDDAGHPLTAEKLKARLAEVEAIPLTEEACDEFVEEYRSASERAVAHLKNAIKDRERYEAEQAELEQLRKDKAAREEEERRAREEEERKAREAAAAEEARRKAEEKAAREAREREEAAERERKEAKEREEALKREAEAAKERERQAREEAERKEKEAKEREERAREEAAEEARKDAERRRAEEAAAEARRRADEEHRTRVHNAIVAALTDEGIDAPDAELVVDLMAKGALPRVSIAY